MEQFKSAYDEPSKLLVFMKWKQEDVMSELLPFNKRFFSTSNWGLKKPFLLYMMIGVFSKMGGKICF